MNNHESFRSASGGHGADRVIEMIYQDIERGLGIVPLLGAGLSVASGIPAGVDYRAYLFYCLARVFGSDGNSHAPAAGATRPPDHWDPRSLRWPNFSDIPRYDDVNQVMREWSRKTLEDLHSGEGDYHDVRWQAVGAVADWRATLHLLSRLTLQKNEKGDRVAVQTYPDQRIIDSFFVHLTNNRHPNSAYLLLAHLADILRVKIILTTNFDNLIESAFQSFSMPVAVYDVHMDASLPDADFVRAQRSIIKIHGGRYGLRADFSLDKYPSADDVERFSAYLSLYDKDYHHLPENQRNVLVMGVSGNERRTIALLCRAMTHLKGLKIFWICYREGERDRVREAFETTLIESQQNERSVKACLGRLHVSAFPSPSLFLLELYQRIFLSLPPAGVQFPVRWTMAPRTRPPAAGKRRNAGFWTRSRPSCRRTRRRRSWR